MPKTRPLPANPRKCRRFSHTWKSHRRDRTGWLGREDSNLRVAETASFQLHAHADAFPRFSARIAMPRERPPQRRGCGQKGRPLRGARGATGASGKRIHTALYGTLAGLAQRHPPCGSPALPESDGHRTHRRRDRWV
jgi:hypothetical protein